MTIDEAIKHCEDVAETCEFDASRCDETDRYEQHEMYELGKCAKEHKQLAEWLRELKGLRNSVGAVKLSSMKEALELIRDYKAENIVQKKLIAEYKRLLKAAVEDFNCDIDSICAICKHNDLVDGCPYIESYSECEYNWRYTDEALNLIGGSEND